MDIIQHMSVKVKIGIVGSTGYSGAKLVELLSIRNDISIVFLTSQQYIGKKFSSVYPNSKIDLICVDSDESFFSKLTKDDVDLVFFATPNGMSSRFAPMLHKKNIDVIDLSADYRFRDIKVYEKYYGITRNDIEENQKAIYGLVEFNTDQVLERAKKSAVIIGNPGCYTTSAILALSPALKQYHSVIDLESIIIDGKSGISGAGRKAEPEIIFSELNESCSPYKLGGIHRHRPELEVFFSELVNQEIKLTSPRI
jgi:N-acetyl-gamma-glutamyl-phosphate reductase